MPQKYVRQRNPDKDLDFDLNDEEYCTVSFTSANKNSTCETFDDDSVIEIAKYLTDVRVRFFSEIITYT